jgi:hypothetical protein
VSVATKQSHGSQYYFRSSPFAGLISFVLFVIVLAAPIHASVQKDLDHLASVVECTIWRLESGIELTGLKHDDFMRAAALQYELTVLAARQPQLLEEDYYRLGLSFIARHFAEYQLAKHLLKQELAAQTMRAVRDWLLKEIADLDTLISSQASVQTAAGQKTPRHYRAIIEDLKQVLAKSRVR